MNKILKTVLIIVGSLVAIVIIAGIIKFNFSDNDIVIPEDVGVIEKQTLDEDIDTDKFFSDLRNATYQVLDYKGSSNVGGGAHFVVVKRSDIEINEKRLDLVSKTCGSISPCIFLSSYSYTSFEKGLKVLRDKSRIIIEWLPVLEKNIDGILGNDINGENFVRGSLSGDGVGSSELLVFESIQSKGCDERTNKYRMTLSKSERGFDLYESGPWEDVCGY